MKIIKEIGIIAGILFIAHIIKELISLPIPSPVLGMMVMFILLLTGVVRLEMVDTVSQFFIDNLTILFVPGGVGLITSFALIKDQWLKITLMIILVTVIGIIVTGFTVQLLQNFKRKEGK